MERVLIGRTLHRVVEQFCGKICRVEAGAIVETIGLFAEESLTLRGCGFKG